MDQANLPSTETCHPSCLSSILVFYDGNVDWLNWNETNLFDLFDILLNLIYCNLIKCWSIHLMNWLIYYITPYYLNFSLV